MSFFSEALSPKIVIEALNPDQRRKPQAISVEEKEHKIYGLKTVASNLIRAPFRLQASPGYGQFGGTLPISPCTAGWRGAAACLIAQESRHFLHSFVLSSSNEVVWLDPLWKSKLVCHFLFASHTLSSFYILPTSVVKVIESRKLSRSVPAATFLVFLIYRFIKQALCLCSPLMLPLLHGDILQVMGVKRGLKRRSYWTCFTQTCSIRPNAQ